MTQANPFDTPAASLWAVPAAPAPSPSTLGELPPGTAINMETGEVIFMADGKTPYNRDKLLIDWREAADKLDRQKVYERDLRDKVVAAYCDPNKQTGTENVDLGNGWKLKVGKSLSYKLKSFDESVATRAAVEAALNRMCTATVDSQGGELNPALGVQYAQKLVKWTPELSVTTYKELLPGFKEIIDTVLEIKQGAPSAEIIPPKESK